MFAIAVAVGVGVGLTNGLLVTYLRVPSIVLTLGMLYLVSGITYIVAHGNQVNPYNVPSGFVSLSITSPIAGIPWIVIIAFVFAVVMAAVLRWTRHGRSLYALGSNPEAAELRGLPSRRLVIATFVLSGAAAGLGGAMYLSQYGLVQVTPGPGWSCRRSPRRSSVGSASSVGLARSSARLRLAFCWGRSRTASPCSATPRSCRTRCSVACS